MSSSTPAARRDEDLPGVGDDSGRRQGPSGPTRVKGPRRARRNPRTRGARRTLLALLVLVLALFGGIGAAHQWGNPRGELSPLLGLDLAGGRQIVIAPVTEGGQAIGSEQLDQAIDIIRRRIDGGGVAEAEVSRMGGNISVAIPGNPTPEQLEALSRSSQMRFRPVLDAEPAGPVQPAQRTLPLPPSVLEEQLEEQQRQLEELLEQQDAQETTDPGDEAQETENRGGERIPTEDEAQESDENRGGERMPTGADAAASDHLSSAAAAMTLSSGDEAASTVAPGVPADDGATPTEDPATAPPANPSDLGQITPELQAEFDGLDCTDPDVQERVSSAPVDQPIVACSAEGDEKYILGPAEISGANLTDAVAAPEQLQGGAVSGRWVVNLTFDDEGRDAFAEVTQRLFGYPQDSPQNRFAMVLDGEVISAPTVNDVISGGTATISGNFTPESAQTLANQLKFGALPMSFDVQTSEQISPTLGGEQLRYGIIAGAIGLLLVFVFMLFQYHALGLVAIASLLIAALLAYGSVTLLGWANNFRLTMAGVTGLIVAIGITADSFIVYFERIRDEVRSGRPLRYAVDTGWERARRTLIISDVVNLIAAAVLYVLSESGVKAFAFTLGLTTFIDLVVVFMFTHPIVSILANTKFFGEGRKWSGMEPERLGAKRAAYLGRGQVRETEILAPGRRRHSREELEGGVV